MKVGCSELKQLMMLLSKRDKEERDECGCQVRQEESETGISSFNGKEVSTRISRVKFKQLKSSK